MKYLHAGSITREHSATPAHPLHANQYNWCSDCRGWFYRHTTADCKVCKGTGTVHSRIHNGPIPCHACGGNNPQEVLP